VKEEFDFSQFKHLFLNVRADVGATTYFSEIAMVQTLDNLRANGTLEILDYLERIPDKLIPRKAELIEDIKTRMGLASEQNALNGQSAQAGAAAGAAAAAQMMTATGGKPMPTMGGQLSEGRAVNTMPERVQEEYSKLPQTAKNALLQHATLKA
jgi:hypothetical protein